MKNDTQTAQLYTTIKATDFEYHQFLHLIQKQKQDHWEHTGNLNSVSYWYKYIISAQMAFYSKVTPTI